MGDTASGRSGEWSYMGAVRGEDGFAQTSQIAAQPSASPLLQALLTSLVFCIGWLVAHKNFRCVVWGIILARHPLRRRRRAGVFFLELNIPA